jgi:tol-pal system protein YbgF
MPAVSSGPPIPDAGGVAGSYGATGAGAPPPVTTAALAPPGDGSNPKQLYETAYGYLLQRDYGAAEAAFDDFLRRHPSDSLSGNAQYWLGESHFVRGQYKAAAASFLKGYQSYADGAKAPDSLLKLAMSLDRLGQKDAACSSYGELATKFPNAPASVKSRAQSERQRVGCP